MKKSKIWEHSQSSGEMEMYSPEVYIRKEGKSQIGTLSFHLNNNEKQEQNKSKASRRMEIIKSRNE